MDLTSYSLLLFPLVNCQEAWQGFSVATDRPLSADDWREVLRAEMMLATLDLYQELAEYAERSPVSAIRQHMRAEYRRVVGISPEERHEFRLALEGVRDGGGQSVANLVDIFRRRAQANGSLSLDDSPGWSSSGLPRV